MTPHPTPLTYSVPAAARELAVSTRTLWAWIHDGDITAYRVGGRTFVARQAIEDYVARQHAAAEAQRADRAERAERLRPVPFEQRRKSA